MDAEEARRRVHEGGTMLCMDVPQGFTLWHLFPCALLLRRCDTGHLRKGHATGRASTLTCTCAGEAGTEMSCDLAGLVVGPKFRGIKMIPPGLHFFCWDAGQDKVFPQPQPSVLLYPHVLVL